MLKLSSSKARLVWQRKRELPRTAKKQRPAARKSPAVSSFSPPSLSCSMMKWPPPEEGSVGLSSTHLFLAKNCTQKLAGGSVSIPAVTFGPPPGSPPLEISGCRVKHTHSIYPFTTTTLHFRNKIRTQIFFTPQDTAVNPFSGGNIRIPLFTERKSPQIPTFLPLCTSLSRSRLQSLSPP